MMMYVFIHPVVVNKDKIKLNTGNDDVCKLQLISRMGPGLV